MSPGAVEFPAGGSFHVGHSTMGEHGQEVEQQRGAVDSLDGEDLAICGSHCDLLRLFVIRLLKTLVNSGEEH